MHHSKAIMVIFLTKLKTKTKTKIRQSWKMYRVKYSHLLLYYTLPFIWLSFLYYTTICIILNDKDIHLPTMLVIPLIHKLKVRKLFSKRDLLHVYIMLKQRKSWYNLESDQEWSLKWENDKFCYNWKSSVINKQNFEF